MIGDSGATPCRVRHRANKHTCLNVARRSRGSFEQINLASADATIIVRSKIPVFPLLITGVREFKTVTRESNLLPVVYKSITLAACQSVLWPDEFTGETSSFDIFLPPFLHIYPPFILLPFQLSSVSLNAFQRVRSCANRRDLKTTVFPDGLPE